MSAVPASEPQRLGAPCWTADSVAAAIRPIAQVDAGRANWFLASHAPIQHLRDVRSDEVLTEHVAFQRLLSAVDQEVQVLVKGEPGTGKSHLINWLKLRFGHAAIAGELSNARPVLIQRRTGSLKDALDQLVGQLPDSFARYLDPIRSAITRISESEARARLCFYIQQELVKTAASREHRLHGLEEVFASAGFRNWLCRNGGTVAANVDRLISPSDVQAREDLPLFSATEFVIGDSRLRRENTPQVRELIETFDDAEKYRQRAAALCNDVLRQALKEMTGLGNNQLTDIFRQIRTDLKIRGERLFLFIEDVSTLSVLDEEIINALEPQNDSSLCALTSVTGMTFPAFNRLRENQRQRATHIWSLGNSADRDWRSDPAALDRFVARYLNALRLRPSDIDSVGRGRLGGSDVSLSACAECHLKEVCHATFGSVGFGDASVGLFPLRPATAARLIEQVDESREGVDKTPRGLLSYVLVPLLTDLQGRDMGPAPALQLPVHSIEPPYWTAFQNEYCGNWTADDKRKARILATFWSEGTDRQAVAAQLTRLVEAFRLPPLSKQVRAVSPTSAPKRPLVPTPQAQAAPAPTKRSADFQKLRTRLDAWLGGAKLTTPRDAQTLLHDLLKHGLPFQEQFVTSRAAYRLILQASVGVIQIEDAATHQANVPFTVPFPRNQETYELIVALAYLEYESDGGDAVTLAIHRRTVSVWLRRHQERILRLLDAPSVDPAPAVQSAFRFLAFVLGATKTSLAQAPYEAMEQIMNLAPAEPPRALSAPLTKLYADLPQRIADVRAFVQSEMDLPQGGGSTLFINPQAFLQELQPLRAGALPTALPSEYFRGFSQTRYESLRFLSSAEWGALSTALEQERAAIDQAVSASRLLIEKEGLDASNLHEAVQTFISKAQELKRALAEAKQSIPVPEFDALAKQLGIRAQSVAAHLSYAAEVVQTPDVQSILLFRTQEFIDAAGVIRTISDYVSTVRHRIRDVLADQPTLERVRDSEQHVLNIVKELERVVSS